MSGAQSCMSQNIENIKSCYPLFEQDEYQNLFADKHAKYEEAHGEEKFVKCSSGRPLRNTKI